MSKNDRKPPRPGKVQISRALLAARDTGLRISRLEIGNDGQIAILFGDGEAVGNAVADAFDQWKASGNARKAERR